MLSKFHNKKLNMTKDAVHSKIYFRLY